MARMKGAELITEYLIANKIPYVFGICGHGNVGMLDPLYQARDRIKLVSPRHEQVAAHMADAYFRVRHEPVATLTSCGPGSCNIVMPLQVALSDSSAMLAITANVPTSAVQPQPVPGDQQALPGRLPQHRPPGGEAQLPADPRRHAAAGAAAGDDDHAVGAAGPGERRRAVQRLPGGGRRRDAAGGAAAQRRQRSGASPEEIAAALDMILKAKRPVIFIGHGVTLSEAGTRADRVRARSSASR